MLEKHYDSQIIENRWYRHWEESGCFSSKPNPSQTPFTMVIPPPNVTGVLHLGHVLNNTLQDILARYKRMKGFNVCWVPGTDHAGIATQNMVEKQLRQEGIQPETLDRETFLEKIWSWKEKYGGIIIQQLRKLGASCDWEKERFTMDEGMSQAVVETFVRLYKAGKIYKGQYIVNWCPSLQTALSDDEVERSEEPSHLWHFRYPLSKGGGFLVVATTRPETMLGDTAVAVNPKDERYLHLIGQTITLPLVGREIPIIADDHVEVGFGTGCVKVTPAHDADDFAMGKAHDLPFIVIMDQTARMNDCVPSAYRGLTRTECRAKVVADMEALGLLEKIEDHRIAVGRCYRTKDIIEPMLSEQWFIRMEEMAQRALEPVMNGQIQFYPERWVNTYRHWMENIRDWCISRQLKWGHRIPVWTCHSCKEEVCEVQAPTHCPACGSVDLHQEEDVLDTWASSWLWPFSVFHWPEENPELAYYYPTTTLVTAPDIIFFWVARMIMAGQEFMGEIPFKEVVFNGLIRDMQGRKMSKTLGNSPDPLDIIRDYGADALRFTIVYQTPYGSDTRFSAESCDTGRGFCTKVWNAYRFLEMSFSEVQPDAHWHEKEEDMVGQWILSRLQKTMASVEKDLDQFRFAAAAGSIYNFFWGEFCDWYVELLKPQLKQATAGEQSRLLGRTQWILDQVLRVLHPFMPFITEELWQHLQGTTGVEPPPRFLMAQPWPTVVDLYDYPEAEACMAAMQQVISASRAVFKAYQLPKNARPTLYLSGDEGLVMNLLEQQHLIQALSGVGALVWREELPEKCSALALSGISGALDIRQWLDIQAELGKIERQLEKLITERSRLEKRLHNREFLAKAPQDVVEKSQQECAELLRQEQTLQDSKIALGRLI